MQGLNYPCASKVPVQHRRQAFSSVMSTLAKLHGFRWVHYKTEEKSEYLESAEFFQHQVRVVCRLLIMNVFGNYDALQHLKHAGPVTSIIVNINAEPIQFLLYPKTQLRKSDKSQKLMTATYESYNVWKRQYVCFLLEKLPYPCQYPLLCTV